MQQLLRITAQIAADKPRLVSMTLADRRNMSVDRWQAFVRNAKRLRVGDHVDFGQGVTATAEERHDDGSFTLAFAPGVMGRTGRASRTARCR